ncbi:MAG: hypothetical protein AAFQ90_07655 [Pseudomonadota bacterium]
MSRLPHEFYEDRALRDAARALVIADIENTRKALSGKKVAARFVGTIGDGAKDALEIAKTHADTHQGLIAGVIAALALWFARVPLLEFFGMTAPEANADIGEEDQASDYAAPTPLSHTDDTSRTENTEPLTTGDIHD